MIRKLSILAFVLVVVSSCSTSKGLYSWYNYNDVAYGYMKNPTEAAEQNLLSTYNKTIANQKGTRGIVPPGIYAEKGYLLLKANKVEEGISCLKKEIELYPEAEKFLGRIIKQYEE